MARNISRSTPCTAGLVLAAKIARGKPTTLLADRKRVVWPPGISSRGRGRPSAGVPKERVPWKPPRI
jgi:hypothetical protein